MAKLTDWSSHHNTRDVSINQSLVPKLYVGLNAPSSSDLSGVAAKELSDGWPATVVDRCAARRTAKYNLFVGPTGFSIGNAPLEDICWSLATSLSKLRQPKGLRFVRVGDGKDHLRVKAIHDHWFASTSLVASFVREKLIDDELALVAAVYDMPDHYAHSPIVAAQLDAFCADDTADQYLHVGISVDLGYPIAGHDPSTGASVNMVLRFLKGGKWKGVRGLMYTPTYLSSTWLNATITDQRGWNLDSIHADVGLAPYLRLAHPGLTVTEVTATPGIRGDGKDWIWSNVSVRNHGLSPSEQVGWWLRPRTLFEARHDLWSAEVYAIGNPEFVNRFAAIGEWDPAKPRSLRTTHLCFDWDGERLVDMNPTMKEADKAAVRRLFVSTVVADKLESTACNLGDLRVEQLYQENDGKTVAQEIYKAAAVVDGETLPSMTFAEAITEARKADTKIWHRQTVSDVASFDVDVVRLTGNDSATVATAYDGTTIVSQDPNFCLMCYLYGAELDTTTWVAGIETDPVRAIWGFSISTLTDNSDKIQMQKEFDEGTAYGRGAPLLSKLTGGKRTAMLMSQVAMSRKQFSSFVVGACVMASNARKMLI